MFIPREPIHKHFEILITENKNDYGVLENSYKASGRYVAASCASYKCNQRNDEVLYLENIYTLIFYYNPELYDIDAIRDPLTGRIFERISEVENLDEMNRYMRVKMKTISSKVKEVE